MIDDSTLNLIGRRQAEVRKRFGLTQAEMAQRLGIPMRTLADNERGVSVPGGRVLAAYAELGVSVDWLILGEGQPLREAGSIDAKDLAEMHGQTRIAIPYFEPTDIRDSYIVGSQERHRRAVLSLAPEWVEPMIPVRELGLPDACRLVATSVAGDSVGSSRVEETLVLFDASVSEIARDGLYVLPVDGLLQVRKVQKVMSEQVAVIGVGDRSRVERVGDWRSIQAKGRILGILYSTPATGD